MDNGNLTIIPSITTEPSVPRRKSLSGKSTPPIIEISEPELDVKYKRGHSDSAGSPKKAY